MLPSLETQCTKFRAPLLAHTYYIIKLYYRLMCVCVCFFPFILDFNGRTSRGHVFLLRTLVVGRRQHSESIEIALDME